MKNFLGIHEPYYQTEGEGTGTGEVEEQEETPEDEGKEKEGEGEEEGEDKDKDKDKEDKDKEDKEVLARADYKTIKADFPELFKKHPELKEALFRENAFTEIFPTVEEAREAAEAQATLQEMSDAVMSGDAPKFLTDLKSENTKGFEKFSRAFMPALREQNKDLWLDVISPIVSQFVKNVHKHGSKEADEKTRKNIQGAAAIVHRILFGGDYDDIEKEFTSLIDKEKEGDKDKDEEKELNTRLQEKYSGLYKDVTNDCYGLLTKEIEKGLGHLKDQPGLKKMLIKQIRDEVLSEMDKDEYYLGRMQSLWKRESRNGFSGSLRSSFTTTFLGKAKAIIPKIRTSMTKEVGVVGSGDKEATRLDVGSTSGAKKPMNPDRARKENLSTRGIFDAP